MANNMVITTITTAMTKKTEQRNARHWKRGLFVASILGLVFLWIDFATMQARLLHAEQVRETFLNDPRPLLTDQQLDEIGNQLAKAPFDQKNFNRWLVTKSEKGAFSEQQQRESYAALANLGYRSSSAQLNLIEYYVRANDLNSAAERIDALLRLGYLIDLMTSMLAALENTPSGSEALTTRLSFFPAWSVGYLSNRELLQSPKALQNRLKTLKTIPTSVDIPKRIFVMAADRAVSLKQPQVAAEFQELYVQRSGHLDVPSGKTDLMAYANNSGANDESRFPFEWKLAQARGVNVKARSDKFLVFEIEWDGTGSPLLASRYIAGGSGARPSNYQLDLIKGDQNDLSTLSVRLKCANEQKTISIFTNMKILFSVPGTLPCVAPRLELFGVPKASNDDVDITVSLKKIVSNTF